MGRLGGRRNSDIDDTFSNIKIQQEMASERSKYERIISTEEARHGREVMQLTQQIKSLGQTCEMEK